LIAAPTLLLVDPAFVPGPILVSNFAMTLLVARREWSDIDWPGLRFLVGGRVLGTLAAAGLLAGVTGAGFDALIGATVLCAVLLSVVHPDFERTPTALSLAGLASGVMGTLTAIGGPPVALVYQHASPALFRSTVAVALIVGAVVSIVVLWAAGLFGATEVALSGIMIPGALLGYWLSRFGIPLVRTRHIRTVVLGLSSLAALGVLLRAFAGASG
jgi:uncharacterized membrane protein YfcA